MDGEGCGACVSDILQDSPAGREGSIHIGDIIVEVNGQFVLENTGDEVLATLRGVGTELDLVRHPYDANTMPL